MPASSVLNANSEQFLVTNNSSNSSRQPPQLHHMHSNSISSQYSGRSSTNASAAYYSSSNTAFSQYQYESNSNAGFGSASYMDDSLAYSFANQVSLSAAAAAASSSKSISIPSSNGGSGNLSAIEEIMTLRGLKTSQNVTESVPVPSSEHVAEIVGRQGCKIKALRAKTNTYIKTPVRGEAPMFVITGRKEDVLTAKREIQLAADHFSQIRARRGNSASGGARLPKLVLERQSSLLRRLFIIMTSSLPAAPAAAASRIEVTQLN